MLFLLLQILSSLRDYSSIRPSGREEQQEWCRTCMYWTLPGEHSLIYLVSLYQYYDIRGGEVLVHDVWQILVVIHSCD